VNAGTHATSLLQQVIQTMGGSVSVDGCIGPATMKALEALAQDQVYQHYKAGRIAYYQQLGQRYPQFLQGWLKRVNAFPDLC
jgi:lysozyme family protein